MDKVIADVIERNRMAQGGDLISVLQEIQREKGFLSEEAIVEVGKLLKISTTKIYGLATFYDQFRFIPLGRVHFRVCHGTSCYLSGSQKVIDAFRDGLGVDPSVTTKDGRFSYEISSCMGGCGLGPNVYVDGSYVTSVGPAKVTEMIARMKSIKEDE